MKVRQAVESDIHAITGLMQGFNAESFADYGLSFNAEHAGELAATLIEKHIGIVLEDKEKQIVGGIGGLIVPCQFNRDIMLFQEIFFYILQDHRQHWLLVLSALEQACRDNGINHVIIGMMHNENAEKMTRLYHMQGYKDLERHLIKRINQ